MTAKTGPDGDEASRAAAGAGAASRGASPPPTLPVVLVPVDNTLPALDACLAALDRSLPPGTRVWLVDDARAEPRLQAVVEHWLARTRLAADYSRRARPCGPVRVVDEALAACDGQDVALVACDTRVAGDWLARLTACLADDPRIGTATPWCNAGEYAAWPRVGELNPEIVDRDLLALAAATEAPVYPALPVAVTHAVLLRQRAVAAVGGLDADSFGSLQAALADLSQRMAAMGWRNVLCDDAFVARDAEGATADGDMRALAVRWPAMTPAVARFLMDDPLREARERLRRALARLPAPGGQRDLFA